MSWGLISRMGYVAIQTTDVARSAEHAQSVLGLTTLKETGTSVALATAMAERELLYVDAPVNALDRIGLVAANAEALATIYRRIVDRGLRILGTAPLHHDAEEGFVFVGPGGFTFDIYRERDAANEYRTSPYGPDRFGHVNLHPTDLQGMLAFFIEVLEFRISDVVGDDFAYFLRCNAEHHAVALIKGAGWLHHHAWQVQSIADLGRLGDRLFERGENLLMGPVRHGAGHNIAAYYVEPSGAVVELYADMEMIYNDDRPPIVWSRDDRTWATRWSVYDFTEFRSHGLYPASEVVQ